MNEHLTPEALSKRHYKVCAIDADSLLYKATGAATKTTYKVFDGDDLKGEFDRKRAAEDYVKEMSDFMEIDTSSWTISLETEDRGLDYATLVFNNLVKGIKRIVSADKYRLFIGEGDLHRDSVATLYKYKGNRPTEKPEHFYELKGYVKNLKEVTVVKGVESDDAVSVMLYHDYNKNRDNPSVVLAAIDKDLDNSVGVHYNYDKDEWYWVSPEQADFNFAEQMLSGDWAVDGIKGLPALTEEIQKAYDLPKRKGVGKATAELILKDLEGQSLQTLYERVLACYKSFYGDLYEYTSWDGKQLTKTPEEILDENCELLFMERRKGERWLDYKRRTFK